MQERSTSASVETENEGEIASNSLANEAGLESGLHEDGQDEENELEEVLHLSRSETGTVDAAVTNRVTQQSKTHPVDDSDEQRALRPSLFSSKKVNAIMHKMHGAIDESGDTGRPGNEDSISQLLLNFLAALDGSDAVEGLPDLMLECLKSPEQIFPLILRVHELQQKTHLHEQARRLATDGTSLLERAMTTLEPGILDAAISCLQESVGLTPDGHPDKPAYLNNLGIALQTRFERLGSLDDLESAIV
ncbi:hypothetical protein K488DRAFT_75326, partial [Vararia minispora EC-137]